MFKQRMCGISLHSRKPTGSKTIRNPAPVGTASFANVLIEGFTRPPTKRAISLWRVLMRSARSAWLRSAGLRSAGARAWITIRARVNFPPRLIDFHIFGIFAPLGKTLFRWCEFSAHFRHAHSATVTSFNSPVPAADLCVRRPSTCAPFSMDTV